MMITYLFLFLFTGKKSLPKNSESKSFKQKLRHQVVHAEAMEAEALRVEAERIQKLLLPHPRFGNPILSNSASYCVALATALTLHL